MKNINKLIIITLLSLTSCFNYKQERKLFLNDNYNVVVDIDSVYHPSGRYSSEFSDYHIKLFDGKNVEWFEVSYEDYKKIKLKDTLTKFNISNE